MNAIRPLTFAATLLAVTSVHAGLAPVFIDDFNDGVIAPQWTNVTDPNSGVSVSETGGTLVINASGAGNVNDDALYLSNGPAGFRLSTANPFNMQIDYSYNTSDVSAAGDVFGLVFGVGEDLDGQNSAAVGYGQGNLFGTVITGATTAFRVNDAQTNGLPDVSAPSFGTLVVAYDPNTDVLTLSAGSMSTPLPGLVQGTWNADALFISFGVRGNGFVPGSNDTFFDNFQLNTGTLVAVPEPASLGLLTLGGLILRRRR